MGRRATAGGGVAQRIPSLIQLWARATGSTGNSDDFDGPIWVALKDISIGDPAVIYRVTFPLAIPNDTPWPGGSTVRAAVWAAGPGALIGVSAPLTQAQIAANPSWPFGALEVPSEIAVGWIIPASVSIRGRSTIVGSGTQWSTSADEGTTWTPVTSTHQPGTTGLGVTV